MPAKKSSPKTKKATQSNKCPGCGIKIPSHRQLCGMNGMVCDMDYSTDRYGNTYDTQADTQLSIYDRWNYDANMF